MLSHKQKQYKLGIFAPSDFDDVSFLNELLAPKLQNISHVITNNVLVSGELIQAYCKKVGMPFMVYPITPLLPGATLICNAKIIVESDFVYIIDNGESKNAQNLAAECIKEQKRYKIINYTSPIKTIDDLGEMKAALVQKFTERITNAKTAGVIFLNKVLKIIE